MDSRPGTRSRRKLLVHPPVALRLTKGDLNAHCEELFARLAPALSEKTCVSEQMVIEIGTTRVSVLFQQGRTYDVEIVTDALRSSRNSEPQTAGRHLPTPVRLVSNLCSQ